MTSNQISCFLSAARNLNFTVAAEECYITQPALSRSISSLEEDLGVKLFERTNNNLALTPGGERLYKFFDEQSKAFSSVVNNAKFDNDRDQNRLTIGFVRNEFMATKDVDALDVFIKQNPDIKVNFKHFQSAREAIESAITQKVDVIEIMEAAALKTPMLRHVSICEYKRCVVVSRQSEFANKTAMSLSEFKDETFIAIKPEHSSTMLDTVLRVCREAGFSPKNVIEATDIQELIKDQSMDIDI
ncbi:MAG: LysR family transcriptional regulator [Clostridia bacterium]|nr:LysR family transcriptional regulator [Clostridia bacterium]